MLPFGELIEWDLDSARKQALEQRPSFGKQAADQIAEMDVRREHAKYIPDVSSRSATSIPKRYFLPRTPVLVGFQVQWQPSIGVQKHRIAELKATTEQRRLPPQDVGQQILMDVEDKFRKLEEARTLLDAQTDQREAEQAKLREVTDRYNQKAALLADLMQQQAAVSQAEAQLPASTRGILDGTANFEKG